MIPAFRQEAEVVAVARALRPPSNTSIYLPGSNPDAARLGMPDVYTDAFYTAHPSELGYREPWALA